MQVWLQHTWCQSSPRNHTMLIKDGAWWAQKASKVDQLQNKQNLHVFFRNNRKSLQIDTKRNDMLNLKRFQSATSRQPGCYATNIRIYGWILWNLNLPGSRLNPLFFCWTNPWWIQRPLRVLLGAKICLFSKKRTSFFQVTLWSRKWRPLWTFKKGHLNIPPKGHLGSNLENLNFFPYAKKVFFFSFGGPSPVSSNQVLVSNSCHDPNAWWAPDWRVGRWMCGMAIWWLENTLELCQLSRSGDPKETWLCIGYTDSQKEQNFASNFK